MSGSYSYGSPKTSGSEPSGSCEIVWDTSIYEGQNNGNPWTVAMGGDRLRFDIEDSGIPNSEPPVLGDCGGENEYAQSGQANGTITAGPVALQLDLAITGLVEHENSGFDLLFVFLNGVLIATGNSLNLGQGCVMGAPEITFIIPPPYFLPAFSVNTLEVIADTVDANFHYDAYYQLDFTCEAADGSGDPVDPDACARVCVTRATIPYDDFCVDLLYDEIEDAYIYAGPGYDLRLEFFDTSWRLTVDGAYFACSNSPNLYGVYLGSEIDAIVGECGCTCGNHYEAYTIVDDPIGNTALADSCSPWILLQSNLATYVEGKFYVEPCVDGTAEFEIVVTGAQGVNISINGGTPLFYAGNSTTNVNVTVFKDYPVTFFATSNPALDPDFSGDAIVTVALIGIT